MPDSAPSVRVDKWLWAVRLYKTRTSAAEACRAGHVKINGHSVKPARDVHAGEIIVAQVGPVTRTVKVVGLIHQRVGPKLVSQHLEELTPPEEFEKKREASMAPVFHRPKGLGRPTKKDRRAMTGRREKW